jgi:hypothetical protein
MALIRNDNTDIIVEVSDLEVGETTIKRKAEVVYMNYSMREKKVQVTVEVQIYSKNADGSYGEKLSRVPSFASYYRTITASLDQVVDVTTGEILGTLDEAQMPGAFDAAKDEVPAVLAEDGVTVIKEAVPAQPAGKFYGKTIMPEFEWFKNLAATQPVIVDNMIIAKIQQADSLGRLN